MQNTWNHTKLAAFFGLCTVVLAQTPLSAVDEAASAGKAAADHQVGDAPDGTAEWAAVAKGEFRGVWYGCGTANTLAGKEYVYSGAKATYCTWLRPMAIYAKPVDKTFFVFGDLKNRPTISWYDHGEKTFAPPVALGINPDRNAHRNPTLLIDEAGYLYVFRGYRQAPMVVLRSFGPYDISRWMTRAPVDETGNASYPQPWQLKAGEIFVSYRQEPGWRSRKSKDGGLSWEKPVTLVSFADASVYAISIADTGGYPRKVHLVWSKLGGGTPDEVRSKHLWARRYDVYYACSEDGGRTWRKTDHTVYDLPITEATGEKVYESGEHGVWLKDIQLDANGNAYILFVDAEVTTYASSWKLARHIGGEWQVINVARSDHMYDGGALVILSDDDFRVYAPTTAVQPGEDGGEIEEWRSVDQGKTWKNAAHVTEGSRYSHNHVKTVFNHRRDKGVFRVFWCYGDATDPPATREVHLCYYGEALAKAQRISR